MQIIANTSSEQKTQTVSTLEQPIISTINHVSDLHGKDLFRKILKDTLPSLYRHKELRPIVFKEINKVINCGKTGDGVYYACTNCELIRFVPHTCKSRFCPSCGNLYNMQRSNNIAEHLFNVKHRHIIFTIPSELRLYFLKDRSLLDILFEVSYATVDTVLKKTFKGTFYTGVICVAHTFSRSSDWNPHIHCIVAEGGLSGFGKWYPRPHISYDQLRLVYKQKLLRKLRDRMPNFRNIADELYKHEDGFFVSAKPMEMNASDSTTLTRDIKRLVKYVTRYLGRPCIATSRIDRYDGHTVTWHYDAHVGNGLQRKSETLSAEDFVLRLAQHIQDQNYRMVRYYGLYAPTGNCKSAIDKALSNGQLSYLYSPSKHAMRNYFCHFRGAHIYRFKVDPLQCPKCHEEMEVIMAKSKGKTYLNPSTRRRYTKMSYIVRDASFDEDGNLLFDVD